jgi:hypothetical protein
MREIVKRITLQRGASVSEEKKKNVGISSSVPDTESPLLQQVEKSKTRETSGLRQSRRERKDTAENWNTVVKRMKRDVAG